MEDLELGYGDIVIDSDLYEDTIGMTMLSGYGEHYDIHTPIDKEDAIKLIEHLKAVFDLEDIFEQRAKALEGEL